MILSHGTASVGGLPLWEVTLVFNWAIAICYACIAGLITRGIFKTRQLDNVLAWATAAIFASCSLGHTVHAIHLTLPTLMNWGLPLSHEARAEGVAMRAGMGDWHSAVVDGITVAAAITYLTVRHRLASMLHDTPILFRDYREKRRRALEINDNLVQGLVTVKMALDAGQDEMALEAVRKTLAQAQGMMSDLLGMVPLQRGDLVRDHAATPTRTT